MTIEYYPLGGERRIEKFIQKDLSKRPDLKKKVETFLSKLEKSISIQAFIQTQQIKFLESVPMDYGKDTTTLGELRIPKTQKGGVVRIYFIVNTGNASQILLLDGEIKHTLESDIKKSVKTIVNRIRY